jgi:tetratricopeptide (TPR) repeat protein
MFDESQSAFAETEPGSSDSLEQADLPDWIKAMKPADAEPAASQEKEDLPDWIANIGTGALASQADDLPDWMKPAEQTSDEPAAVSSEQPDWMSPLPGETSSASSAAASDDLDWLDKLGDTQPSAPVSRPGDLDWIKNLGETNDEISGEPSDLDWMKELGTSEAATAAQSEEPDWLKGIGDPQGSVSTDQPDWLKGISAESETVLPAAEEQPTDWFSQLGEETRPASPVSTPDDADFLNQLSEEPILNIPAEPESSSVEVDKLGISEQERDDSFAWLESLAAKQGATEGLLTRPEDRLEEEPDWVKQAKGMQNEIPAVQPAAEQPPASVEDLGKNEQDQDDAFAWLEGLAAKQGATEGLLTKPEERLDEEPEWVKRAKDLTAQEQPGHMPEPELEQMAAMQEPEPEPEPPATVDHTSAWMESLMGETQADFQPTAADAQMEEPAAVTEDDTSAAEQPAAVDETPDWLRGIGEDAATDVQPVDMTPMEKSNAEIEAGLTASEQPALADDTPAWLRGLEKEAPTDIQAAVPQAQTVEPAAESAAPVDEIDAWLKELEGETTPSGPTGAADETAMWLKGLDERNAPSPEPASETSDVDLPAWMKDIDEESSAPAAAEAPEAAPDLGSTWMPPAEEAAAAPAAADDSLPSWLSELEKEEEQIATHAEGEDLPDWLRGEEAAPSTAEPTLASDWKPVDDEPVPSAEVASEQAEPMPLPSEPFDIPLEEPALAWETESISSAESEPETDLETPAPGPMSEPLAGQEAGGLNIPHVDSVLGTARSELSGNNVNAALESYGRLIKNSRYLDEVIYDLREATYRYPVDVNIWQSLGDAYMRANRLQDALDAYTKAEELLR